MCLDRIIIVDNTLEIATELKFSEDKGISRIFPTHEYLFVCGKEEKNLKMY